MPGWEGTCEVRAFAGLETDPADPVGGHDSADIHRTIVRSGASSSRG